MIVCSIVGIHFFYGTYIVKQPELDKYKTPAI